MTLQAFLALIRQARRAQRTYYQTRSDGDLREAQRLGRELDKAVDTMAQRMETLEHLLSGQQNFNFTPAEEYP
jgi:hypothetical protein